MKYLKKFAKLILKNELKDHQLEKDALYSELQDIQSSKTKLEKKIKRLENPEHILLKYYRIDNVDIKGIPPSYLNPQDKNDYIQRISELESIYRNRAFRELIAWSLNFHANMAVSGRIINEFGDEIEISTDSAKNMISGIRAIWDLIVAGHNKDRELTPKAGDTNEAYDILDTQTVE